jgi:hypothetical protein
MPSKAEMRKLAVPLLDARSLVPGTYFPKCLADAAEEEEGRNPRSQMALLLPLQCLSPGGLHLLPILLADPYRSFPPGRP